jgi:hypothetical protein
MWVKDVRNYDVDIYEGEKLIYSGNVNDCPEEIKQRETKNMTIGHKRIKIDLK